MEKKLNGFNNGRDTTDGIGGKQPTMNKQQYYYLINNKIMKGSEMPQKPCYKVIWDKEGDEIWNDWKTSLQPCEISESELEKLQIYLIQNGNAQKYYNKDIIDVTDLIGYGEPLDESSIFLYYFKQPKQVDGEIEAVELNMAIKHFESVSQESFTTTQIIYILKQFKNRK